MPYRLLIALSLIQTVLIGALLIEERHEAPGEADGAAVDSSQFVAHTPSVGYTEGSRSTEDFRRVIREEFARLPAAGGLQQTPAPRNAVEDLQRRSRVESAVSGFKRSGSITFAQLDDMQREIALLDPNSRDAATRQLLPAINRGEIRLATDPRQQTHSLEARK